MSDLHEYLSYGAAGAAAFVVVKWILPLFQAVINKAGVETSIYGNAKDMIDYMSAQLKATQARYDEIQIRVIELEKELALEREKCRQLQQQVEALLNESDEN